LLSAYAFCQPSGAFNSLLAGSMLQYVCQLGTSLILHCVYNCCRSLGHNQVTSHGRAVLNAIHGGRLRQLRLDGCRMCISAVASTLWHQPGKVCLWDDRKRGHLPRWVNITSTLLWMGDAVGDRRRLRLWHAPEPSWLRLAVVVLGLAAAMLVWLLLVVISSNVTFSMFLPLLFRAPSWGPARWIRFWLEFLFSLWEMVIIL
jgi:hypothetical protein